MPLHADQIERIAARLVRRYGPGARAEAAAWADAMFTLDDPRNAVLWTQVSAAVVRRLERRMQPAKPRLRIKAGRLETASA